MSEKEFNAKIAGAIQKARAYLLSKYQIKEQDLQDILQDASLKALKNIKSFRGKCAFETWFISICKNEVNALFRKHKKLYPNTSQNGPVISTEVWSEPEVITRSNLDEKTFLISHALQKLSEKHKQVIELFLQNADLSSQEIAQILSIPINSARTRLHYAKKHLKKLIESHAHQSNIQFSND